MANLFHRNHQPTSFPSADPAIELKNSAHPEIPPQAHTTTTAKKHDFLPRHQVNHNGHKITKHIAPEGESGRKGIHPLHFFKICWSSTSDASRAVNLLWPFVPAALAVRYSRRDLGVTIFALCYIAMVPCANLIGFAGQELARKMPRVFGILVETTLGSIVEIVLFMVLLSEDKFSVIQAAILGSILATLLLCLGMCFFVGGLKRAEQKFDDTISEVGSGLLLTAGLGLTVPTAFFAALQASDSNETTEDLESRAKHVSRIASIFLIVAYAIYIWFQVRTHHSIYDAILLLDEENDDDRHKDLRKPKLTFTECVVALAVSIALVTLLAIGLVEHIPNIVEKGVSDAFVGLILVPLVEKAAEHLTAVDEAWDNQMNFALSHVLGATIQTALFNAPLVVIVGWGLDKDMDLNFEVFMIVVLILAILVVGNFLRDQKSNYLEGAMCLIIYCIIAVAAYYYPNPAETVSAGEGGE
ncbi:Vacuolar calcium ion transporter [Lachnellula hyalina]|uniref:Vacuolar calcium ion transporter n=1 Tax=Lachnellula hyalina TaxID=1316788 RepID=A0A8H8TZ63_9HELO|nr:Vacuolar calcium ion transporter [Lachnellula hyalina]TVY27954.1 Vacuolar calcium ion transporter [Lachnellula hyalina]